MASSNITKLKLLNTYRELLLERGKTVPSVKDVVAAARVSRPTFYHHFTSLPMLERWGYRFELAQLLDESCLDDALVRPPESAKDAFPQLAFYARWPSGARQLDSSLFFAQLSGYLETHRDYYRYIIERDIQSYLTKYLFSLYFYAFLADVRFIVGGRSCSYQVLVQFARQYLYTSLGGYFTELRLGGPPLTERIPDNLPNYYHDSLYLMIERYFNEGENRFRFSKLDY